MELFIYFAIAVFVLLRLFTIIGRVDDTQKQDYDGKKKINANFKDIEDIFKDETEFSDEQVPLENDQDEINILNSLNESSKASVENILKQDKSFSLKRFLSGVDSAFEIVLRAYQDKDKSILSDLMSKKAFKKISQQLSKFDKQDQINKIILVSLKKIEILNIEFLNNIVNINVQILSEQIRYTQNKEGDVIDGDIKKIKNVNDTWFLKRDIRSDNPNWVIFDC